MPSTASTPHARCSTSRSWHAMRARSRARHGAGQAGAIARTNAGLGYLDADIGNAIAQACSELAEGRHREAVVVDALQGGAGTSLNMNVNKSSPTAPRKSWADNAATTGACIHDVHHVQPAPVDQRCFPDRAEKCRH